MILGQNSASNAAAAAAASRTVLDDMFRRAAERRPDALALVDPPNREEFDGTRPRKLTYAQADRMVSAIAGRLRRIGLPTDAIVGFQLAHTVESVLLFLAILRAGMIAAPLPFLWRRSDCIAALSRIGAKSLVTCNRHYDVNYCQLAMQVAAEIFPIRYVCGFGTGLADGVIPLDDLYDIETLDPLPSPIRDHKTNPAAHLAVITWDVTAAGLVAVPRNHIELLAGGLAVFLEGRIGQESTILSACPITSFSGLCLTVLSWLFSAGTLLLHQPFEPKLLAAQIRHQRCDTLVIPGALVPRIADAGLLPPDCNVKTILAAWRSPERIAAGAPWRNSEVALIDVMVFGEIAILAAARNPDGKPASILFGSRSAPHGAPNAVQIGEIAPTDASTVAIRGPMVPRNSFPEGAERYGHATYRMSSEGYVDTGYTCRPGRDTDTMIVTGPPPGLVSVGGYRFDLRDLQSLVSRIESGSTLAGLPDGLTGHRLAGQATDHTAMRHALAALGVNPLIERAFRDRPQPAKTA